MRRLFTRFLCGSFLIAVLASCGGGDLGGGIGEFTTVRAGAESDTLRLESDVLEGNSCGGTPGPGTYATDSVNFTITSTRQFTTGTALDLVVTKITVRYDPVRSGTPNLPDLVLPLRVVVPPGTSVTVPVEVLTDLMKYRMVTDPNVVPNLALCSADYFEYYVTVTFEVSEPGGNGDSKDIRAYFKLAVADRAA